ncbi:hypothetical protein EHQ12_13785 [Leptospira gomenensis]|uniref:Uncharacterized protein n=1 Tax=Leptospira gomenensis TaxID=2484974 RepID=A0A5F1Y5W8_9LEPT|nr:hypothetical protein [Leptospira gomenensis]TGK28019.1 hypothetical protein EHQ17_18180 [Leptospira gomenensis]TGK37126.1 hypothetical protein EHQ12_13785 [Leptospira gomenensis]TGK45762.1 hypothetical protein EHQ07_08795 [Leptospira gomenensis]TGK59701.1 hypothetical protein EHQ13_13005 [Leptospira gomenensis]
MNISSGVQRISFPGESLAYVSPVRLGGKVQAVEPVRREDFSPDRSFPGKNFASIPKESLPETRGRLIDFYA